MVEFDEDGFLHCPFCSCVFCSVHDLDLHLKVFGSNADLHRRRFNRVHFDVELTYSRAHGGADKIIRGFESIILGHRKSLIKHGVKCFVDKDGLISSSLDDFIDKSGKTKRVKGLDEL